MSDVRDVVLGGGLAGLTAAYTLQTLGETDWQLFEKEQEPGGHARSVVVDGYTFDYGPHILFTADAEMERLIRELLGENLREQRRRAYIYHRVYDRYTRFPFQAHLYGLPVPLVRACLGDLVRASERRAAGATEPGNYEEWMRAIFGDAISEHLMIPYARKLWTVEPEEMDFDWIGRRVPTPDVDRIIAGALTDDVAEIGATAMFWYPWHGGIQALPDALARRVENVHVGHEVERIDLAGRVVSFAGGGSARFDRLLYTLPLKQLPRLVPDLPARVCAACEGMRHQGILNVNVAVRREAISDLHWIYYYEDEFPFHRLSFPGNFSPNNVPAGTSSISIELAYPMGGPGDVDAHVERTLTGLRAAGLVTTDDEVEVVHVEAIEPAYVIYDLRHREHVELVRSWLLEQRVWNAGRFGEWEYFNMDHAMRSGRIAAEAAAAARSGRANVSA